MCCKLHVLQIAYMFQIAPFPNCTCSKLHVLHIHNVANWKKSLQTCAHAFTACLGAIMHGSSWNIKLFIINIINILDKQQAATELCQAQGKLDLFWSWLHPCLFWWTDMVLIVSKVFSLERRYSSSLVEV